MFEILGETVKEETFTTNVPKILDLKSSSEQIFSENWRCMGASENLGRSDDAKRRKNKEDGLKTKKIVFTEKVFITKMALFLV